MIKISDGEFTGAEGIKLFCRYGASDGPVRHTLAILHGHGEHIGRYDKFFHHLERPGLAIAAFDFRGHGRSGGARVFVKSFEEYLDDVTAFIRHLEEKHPSSGKTILLGHSFGGLTATHWALRHPGRLAGLVLSSPCLGLRLPEFLVGLNAMLYRICPKFMYQHPIYPPHLTHNPAEVEQYKKDPYIQRKISVGLIFQVLSYMRRLEEIPAPAFPFPVYILAAQMEKVVDLRRTRAFFEKLSAPVKEMKEFPGFYHEIFNEIRQEEAFQALGDCIDRIAERR